MLLGIVTGIGLEKVMVSFFFMPLFWKMPFGQNYASLLEKSVMLRIFLVAGGAVRRETAAVPCYTETTSCKVTFFCICIDFFILSVCTLKPKPPERKTSVLPHTVL